MKTTCLGRGSVYGERSVVFITVATRAFLCFVEELGFEVLMHRLYRLWQLCLVTGGLVQPEFYFPFFFPWPDRRR